MKVYLAWIGEHEPSLHGVFADHETAMRSATIESARDFAEMLDSAANIADWWKERGPDPVNVREYEVIEAESASQTERTCENSDLSSH